eukprot:scaffold14196_cov104-Isochrysis_galbana.AAC.5
MGGKGVGFLASLSGPLPSLVSRGEEKKGKGFIALLAERHVTSEDRFRVVEEGLARAVLVVLGAPVGHQSSQTAVCLATAVALEGASSQPIRSAGAVASRVSRASRNRRAVKSSNTDRNPRPSPLRRMPKRQRSPFQTFVLIG